MPASPLAPAWLDYPQDVNRLDPALWARGVRRNPDGEVSIDGVGVNALAQEYGTPLFVLSETDFRARARAFYDAFTEAFAADSGADVYYAGKAFLSVDVARWMNEEGLRIDTCSAGELATALAAQVTPTHIGLHGNNKSDQELQSALSVGLGRIIVDSLDELHHLESIAAQMGLTANVLLRLTPGVHAHTHEFIATAHEDQKFGLSMLPDSPRDEENNDGVPSSPAERAVAFALASEHITLLGIHSHIGSQIFDADGFEVAARKMISFLAGVRDRHGVELPELDLGGGYGISYVSTDDPRDVRKIAHSIAAVVRQSCAQAGLAVPRISIEPGRAIAGPSTFTLYRAGVSKDVRVESSEGLAERRYISVDGGMSDNPRPVLYDADYSAVLASRTSAEAPVLSRVVGKHCESGDIVVRDTYLPTDTGRGDLIAVPATGAYCWVLSSNYNLVGRPPVVAVADGHVRMLLRGETLADVLARDLAYPSASTTDLSS